MKDNYQVFSDGDGLWSEHDNLEEAKKSAQDLIQDILDGDGFNEDTEVTISKVIYRTAQKKIADRKDYTDEEWEEEGYSLDHNYIADLVLEEVEDENQDNSNPGEAEK